MLLLRRKYIQTDLYLLQLQSLIFLVQFLIANMAFMSQIRFRNWSMICFSCWFFCFSFCGKSLLEVGFFLWSVQIAHSNIYKSYSAMKCYMNLFLSCQWALLVASCISFKAHSKNTRKPQKLRTIAGGRNAVLFHSSLLSKHLTPSKAGGLWGSVLTLKSLKESILRWKKEFGEQVNLCEYVYYKFGLEKNEELIVQVWTKHRV